MSSTTKKKFVSKEVLDDFVLPEEKQQIVRVVAGRGNNLHEVETAAGDKFLVSMPTRFRKHVWIKRGDYILVEDIEEGDKVKGEIIAILYKEQIKYIKEEGKWPPGFEETKDSGKDSLIPDDMLPPSDDDSDEDVGNMVVNVNRPPVRYEEEESEDDEEEEKTAEEVEH